MAKKRKPKMPAKGRMSKGSLAAMSPAAFKGKGDDPSKSTAPKMAAPKSGKKGGYRQRLDAAEL